VKRRAVVTCYACKAARDRADMLAAYIGQRISWLCRECASRRSALAKINGGAA
jgi:hypothetical protein